MKLPDTNLWLALSLSKHTHHRAATVWLDGEEEPDSIVFCRSTQQSFLRLMTTAGVLSLYGNRPLSNAAAWAAYESFISDGRIVFSARAAGPDGPLEETRCAEGQLSKTLDGCLSGGLCHHRRRAACHHGQGVSPVSGIGCSGGPGLRRPFNPETTECLYAALIRTCMGAVESRNYPAYISYVYRSSTLKGLTKNWSEGCVLEGSVRPEAHPCRPSRTNARW